jgi:ureidoacrylate peracid hydrolase
VRRLPAESDPEEPTMSEFPTLAERIEPSTTALVVVDVQNDFCHQDSPLCRQAGMDMSAAQAMVPRLLQLVDAARGAGATVVWIRTIHQEYTTSWVALEQRQRTRPQVDPICRPDHWGSEFYRVEPEAGEPIVIKHRYSAFVDTDLELILRSRGIRSVIMTGVATNVCVESTARDAYMRDYRVVFVDDCSATYDAAKHAATLRNMNDHFGQVVQSSDLFAAWRTPETADSHGA